MRILALIILTMFSACSVNDRPSTTAPTERRSCEAYGRDQLIHPDNDLALLAGDLATRMGITNIVEKPLICTGPGKRFAFTDYYKCGASGYCLYVFIQAELAKKLGDAQPAVIAHEVAHWMPGAKYCPHIKEFVAYTQCEHDIDLRASEVVGVDLMIRTLHTLILFANERGEPYQNAIRGWQMRIRMLEAIQTLSL